jgi:hypothetical protein
MSAFDKSLKLLIENMGFNINPKSEKDVLMMTCSIIKRMVDNIFRNIMIVLSSIPHETTIAEKHINVTKNVCTRCINMYNKASPQSGGNVSPLPSDYFSGTLSPHYTPENGNVFQSTSSTSPMISRHGLIQQFAGGPAKVNKKDPLYAFVGKVCIPAFFKEHGTNYEVSKCAMNVIMLSIHENLKVVFNVIHKKSCKETNKKCALTLVKMVDVVKTEEFMFLRIK